ncbi:unnamed protein product [Arabis nemorensis]|uniref:Uncharacterized protein n=1 Tax=Arabis nemorensis TaxID=586526 RepID=A0A565CPN3_9BRAS|nr:unnamed protein product [Arabis nemorensis]
MSNPSSSNNQQVRTASASQVPSLTYTPVVLSTPNSVFPCQRIFDQPKRLGKENGTNVEAKGGSGSAQPPSMRAIANLVPSLTYTPVVLSAPNPVFPCQRPFDQPKRLGKENGTNVEAKGSGSGSVRPPSMSRDKQREKQPMRASASQVPSFKWVPVVLSAVRPQAPMRVTGHVHRLGGGGGESKGKGPLATDQLHVKQSSTIGQSSGTSTIERGPDEIVLNPLMLQDALLGKGKIMTRLMLQRYNSASVGLKKLNEEKKSLS